MSANVMQLVNELAKQSRWEEAYSALSSLAVQRPNDPQIEYQLGLFSFHQGILPQAERHLKSALSVKFDFADAHYQLGLVLLKQNQAKDAVKEFQETCKLKTGFAAGHLHWGLALSQIGDWHGALGQYNQVIKINPKLVAAYYQAAMACLELGQLPDAAQLFRTACNLNPDFAEGFNGMALALIAMGKPAEAIKFFDQAAKLNKQLISVQRNWAYALVQLGKLEEAITHYQEAINAGSKTLYAAERALIYNDWAVILSRLGRLDEAAEKFTYAIDIDPALLSARLNLGLIQIALSEFELSAVSFEKAIHDHPNSGDPYFFCGVAYLFLNRHRQALSCFTQAQSKGVSGAEINLYLGYVHMALGNKTEAEKHFAAVVQENPSNYLAHDGLGVSLAEQMRHAEAIEQFRQSINLQKDYGLGYWHLAKSLEALGRKQEAEVAYKQAAQIDPACLSPDKESLAALLQSAQLEMVLNKSSKLLAIVPGDLDIQLIMAKAFYEQDHLTECKDVLAHLIESHPESGQAYLLYGMVDLKEGKLADADEKYRRASMLYEGEHLLYFSWGKTLVLLGLHELAAEKFQKACEFDPYDADTYDAWGSTLKLLGRFREAAEVYKQAAEYV